MPVWCSYLLDHRVWGNGVHFLLSIYLLWNIPIYLNSAGKLFPFWYFKFGIQIVLMLAESRQHVVCYDTRCSLTGWIKFCLSLSGTQRRPCTLSLSSSITHSLSLWGQAPDALYLWTLNYVIIWDLGIPDLISRTDFTQLITRHSSARQAGVPGRGGGSRRGLGGGGVGRQGCPSWHLFLVQHRFPE
jgi:hypothetical protein